MGGMHGFGPIPIEENEPVFHHEWEGRVYAMPTPVPIPGGFRYALERLDPALYLASSYYERWLQVKIQVMIEAGSFTQVEFDEYLAYYRQNPQAAPPRREDPEAVQRALATIKSPKTKRTEEDIKPAFRLGDAVRTRNMHPTDHTRLPRYARGKRAQIVNYYGVQIPDEGSPSTFWTYASSENTPVQWLPQLRPVHYAAIASHLTTARHLERWLMVPVSPDNDAEANKQTVLGIVKAAEYMGLRWRTDPAQAAHYAALLNARYGSDHDAYRPAFSIEAKLPTETMFCAEDVVGPACRV
jgi:nitrile hydratase